MRKNLFDNVWVGKIFRLRNGIKAVYIGIHADCSRYELCMETQYGLSRIEHYDANGHCLTQSDSEFDIENEDESVFFAAPRSSNKSQERVIKVNWRDSNNIFHSYVAISDIVFRDGNVQFDSLEDGTITVPINYISSITQR